MNYIKTVILPEDPKAAVLDAVILKTTEEKIPAVIKVQDLNIVIILSKDAMTDLKDLTPIENTSPDNTKTDPIKTEAGIKTGSLIKIKIKIKIVTIDLKDLTRGKDLTGIIISKDKVQDPMAEAADNAPLLASAEEDLLKEAADMGDSVNLLCKDALPRQDPC